MGHLEPALRHTLLWENAADLYRIEAPPGFVFTGRPERAQGVAGRLETGNGGRDRIAVEVESGLGLWRVYQPWQRAVQPCVADLAELTEYLEVGAGLGQHTARLEEQLVKVAVESHAFGFQRLGDGGVTAAFVNAVLLVDVQRLHRQRPAQFAEHSGRLIPSGRRTDQQRDVQLAQGLAQVLQVAQPEVDFARSIIVGQPLLRRDQVHGGDRATLARGGQGGVVV